MSISYEVIIIGGSYAGLSAAMALGRSLRKTLLIDSGKPCNRQTPHSHNFLTQDGQEPAVISQIAKAQVAAYPDIEFLEDTVTDGKPTATGFEIVTAGGQLFSAKKLLFATGIKDVMPDIPGFAACWGISVLHCPYCHGYEVKNEPLAIIANGEFGFEFTKMIHHWTKQLTLITDGISTLTSEQTAKLAAKSITILEKEVQKIEHTEGHIQQVVFKDHSSLPVKALYARPALEQHSSLPEKLGCKLTEQGFIAVDEFKRTSVKGIYAAGDNTVMFRSVAFAVGAGNIAGAMINRELIVEEWE